MKVVTGNSFSCLVGAGTGVHHAGLAVPSHLEAQSACAKQDRERQQLQLCLRTAWTKAVNAAHVGEISVEQVEVAYPPIAEQNIAFAG